MLKLMVILLLTSCASNKPTPYQPKNKNQLGYELTKMDQLSVVTFRANRHTTLERAKKYAEFRAIVECRRVNKYANIIDIFDKTIAKEVMRSSATGFTHAYLGFYPYYSRYSSFGFGYAPGLNTYSTEIMSYPMVEVLFTCSDKVFRPLLMFREIVAKDIKHLVKDLKGAIQVEKVNQSSPNQNRIERGDIFLKASEERIEKVYQFIQLFNEQNQKLRVTLLREGQRLVIPVSSTEVTSEIIEEEKKIISEVCGLKDKDEQVELKKSPLCRS